MRARHRIRAADVAAWDDTRNVAVLSGSGPRGTAWYAPGRRLRFPPMAPLGGLFATQRCHWVEKGRGDVAVTRSSGVLRGQRRGRDAGGGESVRSLGIKGWELHRQPHAYATKAPIPRI